MLLFVDPGPSSPLVPVKIDENEREKKEVSIVVIKKQQIIEHTWRRRRRTPSSAAVAALRSARERQKERDRERERKRDSSERRCNGLTMEGDGAIGVDCRESGFAKKIFL